MRRRTFALGLLILPTLVACGGKAPAANNGTSGKEVPIILAAAAGGPGTQDPEAPVAAAAATPETPVGQVLVMEGLTTTTTAEGSLSIIGKVLNISSSDAHAATLLIELLDASGKTIGKLTYATPGLPTLKPGDRVAWQGRYILPPKTWASVRGTVIADSEQGQ